MKLALTEPQEQFVFASTLYPAMVAGLGSGKTQAGIARLILFMVQEPGINTALYLPTYDLLRLRALPGAEEMLTGLGIRYTTNRSEYFIRLHGYGDLILRSYDRPERIIAFEVAHSIVDEIDTLPKDKAAFVWRKVSERNRQRCRGQNTIGNVTTPDHGFSGFTYQRWVKQGGKEYGLTKARTDSNPFLPDGYVDQIRENYDPILAEMYINGEFVSLAHNKVYHFFDRKKHHTGRALTDDDKSVYVGLDFNIGGTCASVWVIENNRPIAVDEFVSHDTRDFVNRVWPYRKQDEKGKDGRLVTVYPDASGKNPSTNASETDIQIIKQAGLRVDAADSNPPVRDRVNCINGHLAHERMAINTDKCPQLTDAFEVQGYTKKGEPEKFDEHPSIDDWVDGAGYFIHRKFPISKPITVRRKNKGF